ncbi:GH92 family glycosyl hydrolase [Paramuribaculum intestinale]|uniref:GH92 family glycosyl hydrolase n=1 Tax=Paramuribaculum intestinale TaxID=2094151 RepID=UPI0025AF8BA8|nr:GH92 family glycosyl hydrolase [Paramuribaculum intestinale]
MKFRYTAMTAAALAVAVASCGSRDSASRLTDYVDPTIGSGSHGHVFVGASVPYGMVQLGPTSITQAWDWTSGYHESDSTVIGFSHTHLSGTGVGDLFDITLMPVTGEVTYARGNHDDPESGMWSYADRSEEVAKAGYYAVPLTRYGILAEMTATNRVGFHRYTFPATDSAAIVIDLQNGGCWDKATDTEMMPMSDRMIAGHRFSTGWSDDQKVYFAAEFSEPFDEFTLHGFENRFGRVSFAPMKEGAQVTVRVGISPTSVEAAIANLRVETDGKNFDRVAAEADSIWNRELARVTVESDDTTELRKFYTAMYHVMILPATFNDYGSAPAYTILSLWDTYRTHLPLLSIIDRERSAEIVNSMIDLYEKEGHLPVWHLWGCENYCMVGNPGIIPVADAVVKRTPGVDAARAMKAMLATANDTTRGLGERRRLGYTPVEAINEALSYDMEYAIADAAIANAAKATGDTATAAEFTGRSHSWRHYFDASTGFVRGRDRVGKWREPFDPNFVDHRNNDYTEGNAWQYTWLVPHDVDGLVEKFGSREITIERLDSLFTADSSLRGNVSPDITGLIGQYVHGNEPSHHIIYLYSMLGRPDKAAELSNRVITTLYDDSRTGLSGNEDCGQMSAWLVMSALGFYQIEPAGARYWFGRPHFRQASVKVPGGTFTIVRRGDGMKPEKVTLNGRELDRNYITHDEIMAGGELVFVMEP